MQARTARIDPLIRRNNCAPFETISNFFIKIPFVGREQVSYQRPASVNRNPHDLERTQDRHRQRAGNGNRTRMASLEGWNFTIKLCPRLLPVRQAEVNCREAVALPSDFSAIGAQLDIFVTEVS